MRLTELCVGKFTPLAEYLGGVELSDLDDAHTHDVFYSFFPRELFALAAAFYWEHISERMYLSMQAAATSSEESKTRVLAFRHVPLNWSGLKPVADLVCSHAIKEWSGYGSDDDDDDYYLIVDLRSTGITYRVDNTHADLTRILDTAWVDYLVLDDATLVHPRLAKEEYYRKMVFVPLHALQVKPETLWDTVGSWLKDKHRARRLAWISATTHINYYNATNEIDDVQGLKKIYSDSCMYPTFAPEPQKLE